MIRMTLAAAAALMIATPVLAGPFDGTWKGDMSTYKASSKPYTRELAQGRYHCTCSNPPEDFVADGKFHKVSGHTDYDEAMGEAIDAKSAHFAYKLKGAQIYDSTATASDDGKTLTVKWTDTSSPKAVTGEDQEIRLGPAPKGAHAISGLWRDSDKASVSDTGMAATIAQTGKTVNLHGSNGMSYAAVIGGPFVKVGGSSAGDLVSVSMQGPRTLVETYKEGGKIVTRTVWAFSADGKSVRVTSMDVPSGRSSSLTANKQ
jgi:hypothetical protein